METKPIKNVLEQLETYATIQEWKEGLTRGGKSKTLSENTWKGCLNAIRNYLVFVNIGPDAPMTPDDLIEEAKTNIRQSVKRADLCFLWLQESKKANGTDLEVADRPARFEVLRLIAVNKKGRQVRPTVTEGVARQLIYSRIAGFYSHNGTPFPKGTAPVVETESKVSEIDALYSYFVYDAENGTRERDATLFLRFFNELSGRDRVIALGLLTTSQDPVDLFALNVGIVRQFVEANLHRKRSLTRLFWQGTRQKSKVPFKIFFSKEVTEMLVDYVKTERKDANDQAPLFVNNRGRRMSTNLLDKIFREAQERIGIKSNNQHSPFRPKRMRHIFIQAGDIAGVIPGIMDVFTGQKTSQVRKIYLDKTPEALEVVYARIEPYLTIFHPTINDTLAKSHEELQETKTEMHKMKGDMGSELLHLNQELREYKTKVNGMAQTLQQLGEMTPFLQKLAKLSEKKLDKLLDLLESEE